MRQILLLSAAVLLWCPGLTAAPAPGRSGKASEDYAGRLREPSPANWSRAEVLTALDKVRDAIQAAITRQPELRRMKDCLVSTCGPDGLRLELRNCLPFSEVGEDTGAPAGSRLILELVARELGRLPARLIEVQVMESNTPPPIYRSETSGAVPGSSRSACRPRLETLINEHASRLGVDPNLVKAVVRHESGFNPRAVSPKGAEGLMQLMPGTAAGMGVKNSFDPEQNLAGGIGYLRICLDRFQNNVPLAVAAYNAGPERVARYGGIPPFLETRIFVQQVMRSYRNQTGGYLPPHEGYELPKSGVASTSRPRARNRILPVPRSVVIIEARPRTLAQVATSSD